MNRYRTMNTIDLTDAQYVAHRAEDAAALLTAMHWANSSITGVLQCRLYGHSILWDVTKTKLHAGDWCEYEIMPARGDSEECFESLASVVAWILRRNW
jgi:hypothetical protein